MFPPHILYCWKYACVEDLYLQPCSGVTIEDVAVLGGCYPSGHDSSLNLLVLVFVPGAVSLSQVYEVFNVLDLSVVDIYWCVVSHHQLCRRLVHLHTLIFTFIS